MPGPRSFFAGAAALVAAPLVVVLLQHVQSTDEIKRGIPVVGETKEKAGKRILMIRDFGNVYEVEYELSADTLRLSGQVGGVDLSGTWTNAKKKK
jgi:hypothetical protein